MILPGRWEQSRRYIPTTLGTTVRNLNSFSKLLTTFVTHQLGALSNVLRTCIRSVKQRRRDADVTV